MTTACNRWRLPGAWCRAGKHHRHTTKDHQRNRPDNTNKNLARYDLVSAWKRLRHHRGTTWTPWRHQWDTINRAQRNADTFQTPPGDYQDITETPPRHHQGTTETLPRHHGDTTETPPRTPPRHLPGPQPGTRRRPSGAHPPLELTTPSYRYWGIRGVLLQ